MSIKPVDIQVMIPRTIEISKSSNDEAQKNHTILQQQAASVQQHAETSLKQVYSQKRPQDAGITERQKEKGNNGKHQNKKEKNINIGSKIIKKSTQTSTIDIKI